VRDLLMRYRAHGGLLAARAMAIILFTLAGVTLAGVYLTFLFSLLLGVLGGVVLGVLADRAAVAYGRRLGWLAYQAHVGRQSEARARTARIAERAAREAAARGNTGPNMPADLRTVRTAYGAAELRPAPGLLGTAVAAANLAQGLRGVAEAIASAETGPGVAGRPSAHGVDPERPSWDRAGFCPVATGPCPGDARGILCVRPCTALQS
jgi:hypothetical protein